MLTVSYNLHKTFLITDLISKELKMFDLTTVIIFVVILLLSYWLLRKPSKLPPGTETV